MSKKVTVKEGFAERENEPVQRNDEDEGEKKSAAEKKALADRETVIADIKKKFLENQHLDKKDQHEISYDDMKLAGLVPS